MLHDAINCGRRIIVMDERYTEDFHRCVQISLIYVRLGLPPKRAVPNCMSQGRISLLRCVQLRTATVRIQDCVRYREAGMHLQKMVVLVVSSIMYWSS